MLKRIVLLALLAASPAMATQEYILPTLFDVAGVAANDTLNIRATPSASGEILGTLAPDATGIEVTGLDASGQWGQVNAGEQAGWVSMRYLAYRTDVWAPGKLPAGFSCSGTEPFWSFAIKDRDLIWSEPDKNITLSGATVLDTGIPRDPRRGVYVAGDNGGLTAAITPAQCSDGMSDMAYGLQATVIRHSRDAAPVMYSGCCRIGR